MEIIFIIIILIFSIVIHEVSHGAMADSLGDPTARYQGRLTLNPMKHLDPMGSFVVPALLLIMRSPILFGWAKPVPVNPYNFKDQKYGQLKVALAGPLSNFSIAFLFGIGARLIPLELAVKRGIVQNFAAPDGFLPQIFFLFIIIVFINTLLAVFNLIPIPPLDGSHVLFSLFPRAEYKFREVIAKSGFLFMSLVFIIIFLLFPYLREGVFFLARIFLGV
ncbi:MAG: site-2 protease family protein [Candidatus Nealsonbacteria bacterium]|nr:site-2 protease family protein [Candidatus Nealsonbacteria bacterium]